MTKRQELTTDSVVFMDPDGPGASLHLQDPMALSVQLRAHARAQRENATLLRLAARELISRSAAIRR